MAVGPKLDETNRSELIKPVTSEKIKAALHSINNDKAPGPDSYTSAFFKATWDKTGSDIIATVQEFFRSGQLLKQLNTTIITLIPKGKINPTAADFRPIACCNVIYKIITKIMTSRMAATISPLINIAQFAFVQGRNIMDNIHLAQELR